MLCFLYYELACKHLANIRHQSKVQEVSSVLCHMVGDGGVLSCGDRVVNIKASAVNTLFVPSSQHVPPAATLLSKKHSGPSGLS